MAISDDLQHYLQLSRTAIVDALDGLSEYDIRRPLTGTGTNLLGLVKHLAGVEAGYLGSCVRRPAPVSMPWYDDGSVWDGADMWAQPAESRDYLVGLYRAVWANSDESIAALDLATPAFVEWWPAERQQTTFGHLLARVVDETGRHAGQCDIVRELIDPAAARDPGVGDAGYWDRWVATIEGAAATHR